ncbi:MAG: MATE family efflux transporter [Thiotrichales bacterium]|nr:MATE family efflux transporter [Thiotrichales bacterium]
MKRQQRLETMWKLVLDSIRGVEQDYTRIPLNRAVILLAIPMMLETSIEALFAITDIFFVSKLGADAVATVGMTEAVITLIYAIGVGVSMSITALVARRIGEKDPERAAIHAGQAIIAGLALSILVGLAGVYLADDILCFIGASDVILRDNLGYTQIMLGGCGTIFFLFILNGVFRGIGQPVIAMKALWIASIINIILDPCLIFGLGPFPELGIEGAAIATTFGRGVGVIYTAYYLFSSRSKLDMGWRHLCPMPNELVLLGRISAGGIGQFLIATSSWIVLMKIMADFGSVAVAGCTIAIRIIDFVIMPIWGISNSVSTLVGQNLGANNMLRAREAVFAVIRFNVVVMLTLSVCFILFADPVVGVFTDDPHVIEIGAESLRIISFGFAFYALGMVMIQAFNGAGDTYTPTVINGICFWLFQIPLAYWLTHQVLDDPRGVFWAILLAESLMAILAYYLFQQNKWATTVV